MTKRMRTVIFGLFVFLFFLTAPTMVFYSQGYRFNLNPPAGGKKITQTGAFYFKVLSGRAEIYIDGKLKNKTSTITNSVLIKNLLPKTYEVEIKKAGYYPWKKTLEVKEKQVTEAKNIILFPENPQFAILDRAIPKITASATSTDKNKVVEVNNYEIRVVFPDKEERMFLTRFSEKIGDIFWLNDCYLIFTVGNKIKIAEIDDRDKLNIIDLAEFENPEIFWDQASQKLYVSSQEKVYLLENLLP